MIRGNNIAQNFLRAILSIFGVAVLVFLLINILPTDPAKLYAGKHADDAYTKRIQQELGLNRPVSVRFVGFLNDLSPIGVKTSNSHAQHWKVAGCIQFSNEMGICLKWPYLGHSYVSGTRVSTILLGGLVETIVLVLSALFIAALVGIPFGAYAAQFPNGKLDLTLQTLSSVGLAIPSFVAAIFIAWLFGYLLGDWLGLPISGSLFEYDFYRADEVLRLKNLILPACALAIRPMSVAAQLMRNSMIEVLRQDYIRTARAKGLPNRRIVLKHAMVNAINPVIAAFGAWFAALMAGSVFVEFIFGWKGLGSILINAISNQDFPVIIGLTLVVSTVLVFINTLLSAVMPNFDPELRTE